MLNHQNERVRANTWLVVLSLIDSGISWAEALGDKYWPSDFESQNEILSSGTEWTSQWVINRILRMIPKVSPWDAASWLGPVPERIVKDIPRWFWAVKTIYEESGPAEGNIPIRIEGKQPGFEVMVRTVEQDDKERKMWQTLPEMPDAKGEWAVLAKVAEFVAKPSPETLAEIIGPLAHLIASAGEHILRRVPWPVAACVAAIKRGESVEGLQQRLRKGDLGSYQQWLEWEKTWAVSGIAPKDVERALKQESLTLDVAWRELPFSISRPLADGRQVTSQVEKLIEIDRKVGADRKHDFLANWIASGLMVMSVPLSRASDKLKFCPSATEFKRWFDAIGDSLGLRFGTCAHAIKLVPWTFPLSDEWLDALNYFGESEDLWLAGRAEDSTLLLKDLVRGYLENPKRVGLLSWVEVLVRIGCGADLLFDFAENASVDDSVRLRQLGVLLGSKSVIHRDPIALAGLSAELVARAGAEKRYGILRVDCLYHHQEGSAWVQSYLRELLRVLPPTDNRVRPLVVGTLIGIFQKQQSPLHSAEESRTLKLPLALADALTGKAGANLNSQGFREQGI